MFACRELWASNREEEMGLIEECLKNHPFIAIDTEFPGFLRETSRNASEEERYKDMSFSVDRTKLIQLGLTFVGVDKKIGGTWEINFSDFGEIEDARNEKSIEFLKRNGLNLEKIREEGIRIDDFFSEFKLMLKRVKLKVNWITFHGSYDIGYLLKYLTGESLPVTSEGFSEAMKKTLGPVYDLKVIAGRCKGLSNRLGLESLANELGLDRVGTAHHAGSDSELTARAFLKMVVICHKTNNITESEGFIYGIISDRLKQEFEETSLPIGQPHIHRRMMTRCYGLPPPPQFQVLRRPMFVYGYMPIAGGGYFMVPRV